jgi:hypothetical protein
VAPLVGPPPMKIRVVMFCTALHGSGQVRCPLSTLPSSARLCTSTTSALDFAQLLNPRDIGTHSSSTQMLQWITENHLLYHR